jgi:hypothetical protein
VKGVTTKSGTKAPKRSNAELEPEKLNSSHLRGEIIIMYCTTKTVDAGTMHTAKRALAGIIPSFVGTHGDGFSVEIGPVGISVSSSPAVFENY